MYSQAARSRVPLIAALKVTDKGLQACVCLLMSLKMAFRNEPLSALGALKGSLACVGPDVGLKIASLLELLQTVLVWANQEFLFIFWPLYPLNFYSNFPCVSKCKWRDLLTLCCVLMLTLLILGRISVLTDLQMTIDMITWQNRATEQQRSAKLLL